MNQRLWPKVQLYSRYWGSHEALIHVSYLLMRLICCTNKQKIELQYPETNWTLLNMCKQCCSPLLSTVIKLLLKLKTTEIDWSNVNKSIKISIMMTVLRFQRDGLWMNLSLPNILTIILETIDRDLTVFQGTYQCFQSIADLITSIIMLNVCWLKLTEFD